MILTLSTIFIYHNKFELRHEISNSMVCETSKSSDLPAHKCSLIRAFASPLTDHHLRVLRFIGVFTGSSESTLVKMPHCWKSHVMAQYHLYLNQIRVKIMMCFCIGMNYMLILMIMKDSCFFTFFMINTFICTCLPMGNHVTISILIYHIQQNLC